MEYDDIIVGAGSAGAVLAARLSEDPQRSVLLLEAGPDYRTIDETPHNLLRTTTALADHNWGWVAQATAQREIPFHRGKVTGGCSAINSSVAIRGVPADFDQWAASGNSGWSFENVLPFYRKLEHDADFGGDVHGKGGPIWIERSRQSNWPPVVSAFRDSCRAMGFPDAPDFNDPQSTGVSAVARKSSRRNPRLDCTRLPCAGSRPSEFDDSRWVSRQSSTNREWPCSWRRARIRRRDAARPGKAGHAFRRRIRFACHLDALRNRSPCRA
jgi:choline dehydrogenase